jgi:hypothetical protein
MANKKKIEATYDGIRLSKQLHEEAEFTSQTDVNIMFDFTEGTPFDSKVFPVHAGGTVGSGQVRPDVQPGRFRYHVYPMGGGPGADPTIIVTN